MFHFTAGNRTAYMDWTDYEPFRNCYFWIGRHHGSLFARERGSRSRPQINVSRVILGLSNPTNSHTPPLLADHIDGDVTNCRQINLRAATPTQNSRNRKANSIGKIGSRYKGVAKIHGKFRAVVCLGTFATERLAAEAYDRFARLAHGEFAKLNFPAAENQQPSRPARAEGSTASPMDVGPKRGRNGEPLFEVDDIAWSHA